MNIAVSLLSDACVVMYFLRSVNILIRSKFKISRHAAILETENRLYSCTKKFTLQRISLFLKIELFRGPIPEVVQYRADPRQRWSKLLALRHDPKISLISLTPHGGRIRY